MRSFLLEDILGKVIKSVQMLSYHVSHQSFCAADV